MFDENLVFEVIKILGDTGADISRTVISHVDCWGFSPTTIRRILDAGCYAEYDSFGYTVLSPLFEGRVLDVPSDTQRINNIIQLIGEGYLNQILVSHDISQKNFLTTYGGWGYAHVLRDVVPVMRVKGITGEQIHTLLVENPKRLLTFAPVEDQYKLGM